MRAVYTYVRGNPLKYIDLTGLGKKHLALAEAQQKSAPANAKQYSAGVRHLRDDFGRIVATQSPDSGATTRSFDEADHLVASTDALGKSDYGIKMTVSGP